MHAKNGYKRSWNEGFTVQHLLCGGVEKESMNIKYTVTSVSVSSISSRNEEEKEEK